MTLTYAIWQGSVLKGHSMKATRMSEIDEVIKDLNSTNASPKFTAMVTKIEANA
jgi:hypothetical protein